MWVPVLMQNPSLLRTSASSSVEWAQSQEEQWFDSAPHPNPRLLWPSEPQFPALRSGTHASLVGCLALGDWEG